MQYNSGWDNVINNHTPLVLFGQLEKYEQAREVICSGFQIDPHRY